tara:strand:+ start:61 stop:564 length:504 start_codon:yes stop_codon:yes gene_type:complete
MKYIIILSLILQGCGGGGSQSSEHCKAVYYGDSIGEQLSRADNAPDFIYKVLGGRKIIDLLINEKPTKKHHLSIDYSHCKIYIALGTNKAEGDELHLLQLLEGYRNKITCVLPMTLYSVEPPIREVMIRECINIIDPIASGVYPLKGDGVHLGDGDNREHYASIFTE